MKKIILIPIIMMLLVMPAFALTKDDFFGKLIEQKISAGYGYAIFELKNPTRSEFAAHPVNSNRLRDVVNEPYFASKTDIVNYYYLENVPETRYNTNCLQSTSQQTINGTEQNITSWNCSQTNYTVQVERWMPFNMNVLIPASGTRIFKMEIIYVPKIGFNARDWIPIFNHGGIDYIKNEWAWFNTSYNNLRSLNFTTSEEVTNFPFPINGSGGFNLGNGTINAWGRMQNSSQKIF